MSTINDANAITGALPNLTVSNDTRGRGRGRKGRGAQQRRAQRFDRNVNSAAEDLRKETVSARLKLKTPSFNFLASPKCDVATVTIWFYYLVTYFLDDIWPAMLEKGGRSFQIWLTQGVGQPDVPTAKRRRIFKVFIWMCEAKMWSAIRSKGEKPRDFTVFGRFTDEVINLLNTYTRALPKPMAAVINSIGAFEADNQHWLPQRPVFVAASPVRANVRNLISMLPSFMTAENMLPFTNVPFPENQRNALGMNRFEELFGIQWQNDLLLPAQVTRITFTPIGTVTHILSEFNQAMIYQSQRRNWCVSADVNHPEGEPSQLIANSDAKKLVDVYSHSTFYCQTNISETMYGYGIAYGLGFTNNACIEPDRHVGLGVFRAHSHIDDRPSRLRSAIVATDAEDTVT